MQSFYNYTKHTNTIEGTQLRYYICTQLQQFKWTSESKIFHNAALYFTTYNYFNFTHQIIIILVQLRCKAWKDITLQI